MLEIVKDTLKVFTIMNEMTLMNMNNLEEVQKLKPSKDSGSNDSLRGLKMICTWIC